MLCRRSQERFILDPPLEGHVHVLRDIVVCPEGDGDCVQVTTHVPAVADEQLTLDVLGRDDGIVQVVRVVESRPVIVGGQLRHELVLQEAQPAVPAGTADTPDV